MALVRELCVAGLDVPDDEVSFEIPVPEVRGRMDALFGSTVFEFKRDLRTEQADAEGQLLPISAIVKEQLVAATSVSLRTERHSSPISASMIASNGSAKSRPIRLILVRYFNGSTPRSLSGPICPLRRNRSDRSLGATA
jgi:hypothetical protein